MTKFPLQLNLFGQIELIVDGAPAGQTRSRRDLLILAVLALEGGVARKSLAQKLWPFPDHDLVQAGNNLRRSLWQVRRALGPHEGLLEQTADNRLLLHIAPEAVDVRNFRSLVRAGTRDSLEAAIALRRAPLLAEFSDAWIEQEREKLQFEFAEALRTLGANLCGTGEFARAVSLLRECLAIDPNPEECTRLLMDALARAGDIAGALEAYQDLARRLNAEFGRAPNPVITQAFTRIRSQRAKTVRTEPITVITASDSLPQTQGQLLGREYDLRDLEILVRLHRLVTLTGPGGVGKTRTAVELACRAAPSADDGVWFVDLSSAGAGEHVERALAQVLGVAEQADSPLADSLANYLADMSPLIVVDNCEQVLDPVCALIKRLLAGCPGVRFIATSRQPLDLSSEHVWRLAPLPTPDVETLPRDAAERLSVVGVFPSARLFEERARATDPTFRLTAHNAADVAAICRKTDGLPLAIEIAAARTRSLAVEQIARSLGERYLLAADNGITLSRQRTLRETIDWSCDLLSEAGRKLFRRLSAFRGGCTLAAAEGICSQDGDDVSDLPLVMEELVLKSLVVQERMEGGTLRFRLLEPVRECAAERLLLSGESAAVARAHCIWFVALGRGAGTGMIGTDALKWLADLDRDVDNLRSAFDCALAATAGSSDALALAWGLWHFWELRGMITEGRQRLSKALQAPGAPSSPETASLFARVTAALGFLTDFQCESTAMLPQLEAATHRVVELGDDHAAAFCCLVWGWVLRQVNLDSAIGRLRAGIPHAQRAGDLWTYANLLSALGYLYLYAGRGSDARATLEEGLSVARHCGDEWLVGRLLYHLGLTAIADDRWIAARDFIGNSLKFRQQFGDRQAISTALFYMAATHMSAGEDGDAAEMLRRSIDLKRRFGNRRGIAAGIEGLVRIALRRSDVRRAIVMAGGLSQHYSGIESPFLRIWPKQLVDLLAGARRQLGDQIYDAAWWEGRALDERRVVSLALEAAADASDGRR